LGRRPTPALCAQTDGSRRNRLQPVRASGATCGPTAAAATAVQISQLFQRRIARYLALAFNPLLLVARGLREARSCQQEKNRPVVHLIDHGSNSPFPTRPGGRCPSVPGRAIETASGLRAELFGYRYQGLIPVKIQNFRFAILVGRSTSIIRAARPIWKTPSHSSRAAGPTLRLPCVGSTDCLPAQCRGRRLRRTACVSSPTVAQAAGRKLACASSASLNSVRRISIRRRATWHRTPLVEHLFRNRARLKPVVPLRQRSRVESCREPGEILSDPHTSAGRRRILKTAGKGRLSMRDSTA
jgi:hypothetical protein